MSCSGTNWKRNPEWVLAAFLTAERTCLRTGDVKFIVWTGVTIKKIELDSEAGRLPMRVAVQTMLMTF
jgi:hypothetical protein